MSQHSHSDYCTSSSGSSRSSTSPEPDLRQSQSTDINLSEPAMSQQTLKKTSKKEKQPQPDEKTKEEVAKLLAQNSKRLQFLPKLFNHQDKKHADVWSTFKDAIIDEKRVGIFKCDKCTVLYIYKSSTGNTAMNRHKCGDNVSVPVTPKNQKALMSQFVRRNVPVESTQRLNREITIGFAVDLQPLGRV